MTLPNFAQHEKLLRSDDIYSVAAYPAHRRWMLSGHGTGRVGLSEIWDMRGDGISKKPIRKMRWSTRLAFHLGALREIVLIGSWPILGRRRTPEIESASKRIPCVVRHGWHTSNALAVQRGIIMKMPPRSYEGATRLGFPPIHVPLATGIDSSLSRCDVQNSSRPHDSLFHVWIWSEQVSREHLRVASHDAPWIGPFFRPVAHCANHGLARYISVPAATMRYTIL